MNVDVLGKQIEGIHSRLTELYQSASTLVQPTSDLLPSAFKELGIASEELQVALEELKQQNEQLVAAQTEIERQRQRYQDLFEFAPDGYLVTDAAGTIEEANCTAAKLLNVSQRFLVGKPLIIFVPENERQTLHAQLNQMQQVQQIQEWAIRLCPRDGKPFNATLTVATIRDGEGKVVGLRGCMRVRSVPGCECYVPQQAQLKLERNDFNPSQDFRKHIFLKGETIPLNPQTIWQVRQGIVKLSTVCQNGESVLVGLVGSSMVFGADLTSLASYQAIALCAVQLEYFSPSELAASPALAQIILPQIDRRLRQTEAMLAISGQRRVADRFYKLLQLLKQEIGQPVEQGTRLLVRFTHQDFANACGTTRVTITRLLGKLKEQGAITIDRKNHIILIERGFKNVVNAGDIAKHAPKRIAECQTKIALDSPLYIQSS
ncbi:PAS domain-containing protein [Chroococcidiopsis sp. FACHB-1243]|nr:PAS domain-containing protein [Chroococcidiopsis sp. [FACHB-1243]]